MNKGKVTVLELENVEKAYGSHEVLKGINFRVEQGEIFGILGPNGVGKTTLFQTIIGLLKHENGKIKINGEIHDHSKEIKQKIGYLPSDISFYENKTARENLEFFSQLAEKQPDLDHLLKIVGLENDTERKVGDFSTGMKKRLGIAQSMIKEPELIIYDEPTTGLDPEGKREFKNLVKKINKEKNKTIIISSHITSEIDTLCDRFAILKNGKVVASGTKEQLSSLDKSQQKTRIKTSEKNKLEKILNQKNLKFDKEDSEYIIKSKKDIRNQLFKEMSRKEIDIKKIKLDEETLESTYLRLTGEKTV